MMFMVNLTAAPAYAEDLVLVPSSIPYQKEGAATENIRREYTWNTTMPQYLAKNPTDACKLHRKISTWQQTGN